MARVYAASRNQLAEQQAVVETATCWRTGRALRGKMSDFSVVQRSAEEEIDPYGATRRRLGPGWMWVVRAMGVALSVYYLGSVAVGYYAPATHRALFIAATGALIFILIPRRKSERM